MGLIDNTKSNAKPLTVYLGRIEFILIIAIFTDIFLFFACNFAIKIIIDFLEVLKSEDFSKFSTLLDGGFTENVLKLDNNLKEKGLYKYILLALGIFDIYILYKFKIAFSTLDREQKASSRLAELKDIKKQYRSIPERENDPRKRYKGGAGVLISRHRKKIFIDDSPVNTVVIGSTRSGKGETEIVPNLDAYSRAKNQPSIIVNDPKGELACACYSEYVKRGYDVYIFNLTNSLEGMSYNPLQLIIDAYKNGRISEAQLLTNTLTATIYDDPTAKEKSWQQMAAALVNALILALVKDSIEAGEEEKITMYTVASMLSSLGGLTFSDGSNALDLFFQARENTDVAKLQYSTSKFAEGGMRASIFGSAMKELQRITLDELAKMTSKNSVNLADLGFGEKPVAIFMVVPDYDSSNHFLASILIAQAYFINTKMATENAGKMKREIRVECDEAGNMVAIPNLATILTVCLGRGFRFLLAFQSFAQIKKLYGDDAETIVGNCGNLIYLKTQDLDTAKKCSELAGSTTIIVESRSGSKLSFKKEYTETTEQRPLVDANEIMNLQDGENIVIRATKRTDLKGKSIIPYPIYNRRKSKFNRYTLLKYRWKYLGDQFDTGRKLKDIYKEFKSIHKDVEMNTLVYDVDKAIKRIKEYFEAEEDIEGVAFDDEQQLKKLQKQSIDENTPLGAITSEEDLHYAIKLINNVLEEEQKNKILQIMSLDEISIDTLKNIAISRVEMFLETISGFHEGIAKDISLRLHQKGGENVDV